MKDIQPSLEYCFRCSEKIPNIELNGDLHLAGELCVNLIEEMFALMICHDCAVELYRFLKLDPIEFPQLTGLHPDFTDNPVGKAMCCEYAWRSVDDGPNEHGTKYSYDNIMKGAYE
jgi:hypothetical protein